MDVVTQLQVPQWKSPLPTEYDLPWADILTVDLSRYETDREELVKIVFTALERDGFFYVVGHGIAPETLSRQFDLGQLTFEGVSREEKEKHLAPIAEKGSFMGYKLQNYWEIKDGVRDRIEHYNFYKNRQAIHSRTLHSIDPATRHPEPLRPHVTEIKEFLEEARQKVLRRILSLIDSVLGLREGYLWSLHETEGGETGDDLLRYMIYDPLTEEESRKTNGVMLNGHTDFNSISTLVSQPISALQVLMPDNVWRYVKHKDGALVINIGDQLAFMSGGILKGTCIAVAGFNVAWLDSVHLLTFIVVRPPPDQAGLRRLGVFHFAHFIRGIPLDLLPSEKVHKEGHRIFEGEIPTTEQWESTRIKSYGTGTFIKGEEFDIEIIAGLQVSLSLFRRNTSQYPKIRHYH
ncbi:hypothetical protein B0H12DRAFT_1029141 [Mycena haematopus]|nr:hypothetical protein B0H12DRAFT_1029141 [Mycena haematopus]